MSAREALVMAANAPLAQHLTQRLHAMGVSREDVRRRITEKHGVQTSPHPYFTGQMKPNKTTLDRLIEAMDLDPKTTYALWEKSGVTASAVALPMPTPREGDVMPPVTLTMDHDGMCTLEIHADRLPLDRALAIIQLLKP